MNLLAKYIYTYICRIFFYFSNACSTRRREMDVKPMSRFNLLDITAVSIEYRRGCVTNTGWSRKWLRRYIYIRFQWTTGCIEEEIVIASDRSDRKLVCIASLCILCRRNRVTMNDKRVRGLFEFLAALSALQNRGNDSFFLHRFDEFFSFFFFKLEIKEGTK